MELPAIGSTIRTDAGMTGIVVANDDEKNGQPVIVYTVKPGRCPLCFTGKAEPEHDHWTYLVQIESVRA